MYGRYLYMIWYIYCIWSSKKERRLLLLFVRGRGRCWDFFLLMYPWMLPFKMLICYSRTCSALFLSVCCPPSFSWQLLTCLHVLCLCWRVLPSFLRSILLLTLLFYPFPNYFIIAFISACHLCRSLLSADCIMFGLEFPCVPSPLFLKSEDDEG